MKQMINNLKLNKYFKWTLLPMFIVVLITYLFYIGFTYIERNHIEFSISFFICVILLLIIGYICTFVFDLLKKLPSSIILYLGTCVVMLYIMFKSSRVIHSSMVFITAVVIMFMVLGSLIYQVKYKMYLKWYFVIPELLFGMLSLSFVLVTFLWPGASNTLEVNAFDTLKTDLEIYEVEPKYEVLTGVYGMDKYLDTYLEQPSFESKTVSINYFLNEWQSSRENYLGFNVSNVPLNAHYYLPDGEGPFPVIAIVHGNHEMTKVSDIGYDYLGQYLASRGYVVISVDENFLNYSIYDTGLFNKSIGNENDARAYVLLKHIEFLIDESKKTASILHGKVDQEKVGLIGHSRGGEAVAIARFYNEINYLPNNYHKRFSEKFNIDSIVAIAPTDRQYKPSDRSVEINDVNYLLLHGIQDMDVTYMAGLNQYERIHYSGKVNAFKTSASIYGANHGYFNETWYRSDKDPLKGFLYNYGQLMERSSQEAIASQLIYYFLEATLNNNETYREGFENYAAFKDLPQTLYMTQYQDSKSEQLVDFNEDSYLETGSNGIRLNGSRLSKWYESAMKFDGKISEVFGAYIASSSGNGYYEIQLPEAKKMDISDTLYLTLSDYTEDNEKLVDLKITLLDKQGNKASLPISTYGMLQPRMSIQLAKYPLLDKHKKTELFLQTFQLSVEKFVIENEELDINNIDTIHIGFLNDETVTVFVKEIGLRHEIKKR